MLHPRRCDYRRLSDRLSVITISTAIGCVLLHSSRVQKSAFQCVCVGHCVYCCTRERYFVSYFVDIFLSQSIHQDSPAKMEIEMEKLPRKASEAKKVQRHSGKSHARWGSNVRVSMYSSKEKQMIVEAERNNRRLKTEYKMRIATAFALVLFSLWMYILLNADVSQRYGFNQYMNILFVWIGSLVSIEEQKQKVDNQTDWEHFCLF